MMDKLKIPLKTHQCFIGNLEPDNKDGCYPDWSRARAGRQVYKFKRPTKHQEEKVVRHMEKHRGAALHWFQNGHPMKTVTARHDATRVSKSCSSVLQEMVLQQATGVCYLETEENTNW
jgi:hypothetical protein